jgi:hypothetical protein
MGAAIEGGEQVVVDFLLEHGAKLPGDLLARAVSAGSMPLVELALRDRKVVAKTASNDYADPMCAAAAAGNLALLEVLAAAGVPVTPSKRGKTSPLHRAASADNGTSGATLAWLLERAPVHDKLDGSGLTPLGQALLSENYDGAKLLYLAGASLDAVSRDWIGEDRIDALLKNAGKAGAAKQARASQPGAKKAGAKKPTAKRPATKAKPAKKSRPRSRSQGRRRRNASEDVAPPLAKKAGERLLECLDAKRLGQVGVGLDRAPAIAVEAAAQDDRERGLA